MASSKFSEVPVIDVNAANIKELWPSLALALKASTFVAVDTELSGLGNRKLLGARSLPDRYRNICDVAKTRSVLALGLSCFKLQNVSQASANQGSSLSTDVSSDHVQIKQWSFSVQTFNVTLMCSEDFMVEPGALKFLVEHGFDFNKQYMSGVSYTRGKEKTDKDGKASSCRVGSQSGPTARQLFDTLLWSEVPIVVHNGFVDLVFLYQNLYTELPSNLQVFLADVAEMFPQGVLDTKYLVEFVDRLPATYLEYVFRKWQRKNALQASQERKEVCVEFGRLSLRKDHVSLSGCALPSVCVERDFIPNTAVLQDLVCHSFAGHGWCASGKQCSKSHAIDLILDLDGAKTAKNRKRRHRCRDLQQQKLDEDEHGPSGSKRNCSDQEIPAENGQNSKTEKEDSYGCAEELSIHSSKKVQSMAGCAVEEETNSADNGEYDSITESYLLSSSELEKGRSGGHKAGFDAFMTGFTMACILSRHTSLVKDGKRTLGACIKLSDLTGADALSNKIYTMGKDHPMIVGKSNFCNPSKNHSERIQQLRK